MNKVLKQKFNGKRKIINYRKTQQNFFLSQWFLLMLKICFSNTCSRRLSSCTCFFIKTSGMKKVVLYDSTVSTYTTFVALSRKAITDGAHCAQNISLRREKLVFKVKKIANVNEREKNKKKGTNYKQKHNQLSFKFFISLNLLHYH